MTLTKGAASPDGKHLFLLWNNAKDVEDRREEFAFEKDALRPKMLDFQPEPIGKSAIAQTHNVDGWQIDELNITARQTLPGAARPITPPSILKSWTWSADGESGYLLTSDGVLYKLRTADRVLESKIDVPLATHIAMTSEGLVVVRDRPNEILLFEPGTLALKQTFAVFAGGQFVGNPRSSRIWQFRDSYERQATADPNVVLSFDVKTGRHGRGYNESDLRTMTESAIDRQAPQFNRMAIERPVEIQVSRDNRYLFISDGNFAARFGIHDEELALHEISPQFTFSASYPLVLSPDGHMVALGLGLIGDKVNGFRILSSHDFKKVLYELPEAGNTTEYCIVSDSWRIYSTTEESPLIVLNEAGKWRKISFAAPKEQRQIEPHPTRDEVLLHGSKIFLARPVVSGPK
jgi:hypothetical protein